MPFIKRTNQRWCFSFLFKSRATFVQRSHVVQHLLFNAFMHPLPPYNPCCNEKLVPTDSTIPLKLVALPLIKVCLTCLADNNSCLQTVCFHVLDWLTDNPSKKFTHFCSPDWILNILLVMLNMAIVLFFKFLLSVLTYFKTYTCSHENTPPKCCNFYTNFNEKLLQILTFLAATIPKKVLQKSWKGLLRPFKCIEK